ncbi:MAG: penicillin-binding protein 2 [Patescibacteria group bacterium]
MIDKFFKNIHKNRAKDHLRERGEDPFSVKEGRFSFGRLKDSFYYTDWTEESFLADTGHKETVSRSFDFSRLKYFILAVLIGLLVLIFRAAWLQISQHEYYSLLAEGNRLRAETIEPKRGIIYDRNLSPLVRNKANFVLYLRPINLPAEELARDQILREIIYVLEKGDALDEESSILTNPIDLTAPNRPDSNAGLGSLDIISDEAAFYKLKEDLGEIKRGSLESYQPFFVADNIDYAKAMLVVLKLPEWPGVFLSSKIRREYLAPAGPDIAAAEVLESSSLAHVLGYTGKISEKELENLGAEYSSIDYIGKTGIELSWEKELKGKTGQKNIEVDALGRQKKIINETPAEDGYSLQLSIDAALQNKTEEITRSYLTRNNLSRASVVIMDPNNGEILSLVSLPAYDNNLFARGISQEEYDRFLNDKNLPLFNRPVSGEFPSGSTIKPIFAAAALEEGIITERTSFLSTGGLAISAWFFPDWKAGGHGATNVRKALAESVNTFFYYIGGGYGDFSGLGLSGLIKYSRLFGLGEPSGIDLPGERSGFVPTAEWKEETKGDPWYIGDTYHFAIGQGDVLVTPLQVANYTAAIANNGILYQPRLVTKILGDNNEVIREIAPEIIRQDFIDPANLEIVRQGMRETITVGSAQSLYSLPVAVAGKTGTAQWSVGKDPHAWFTGFAPYENPEIVITVLVEEGVEGSTMAAPIARDILSWYYSSR